MVHIIISAKIARYTSTIRESVDSLCGDGVDVQYLSKSHTT